MYVLTELSTLHISLRDSEWNFLAFSSYILIVVDIQIFLLRTPFIHAFAKLKIVSRYIKITLFE